MFSRAAVCLFSKVAPLRNIASIDLSELIHSNVLQRILFSDQDQDPVFCDLYRLQQYRSGVNSFTIK